MRRFVSLAVLLFFTVPFGASVIGCGQKTAVTFCNGGDSGPVVGQVKSVTLSPNFATFGESLNFGQIGSGLSASAVDCKGNAVSSTKIVYATSDMSFADINPSTGQVCGGTYNRNTGGGIPDYTTCIAPINPPASTLAYVTATADGAVSNAIPVYVHPIVTGIVLGNPTPTNPDGSCKADPLGQATNCCAVTTGAVVTAPPYLGGSCLSQGVSAQLTARAYKNGTTNAADNITCSIGHLQYSAQNLSVLTIDENGVATAAQPGSTIITGNVSNSGSGGAAGYFATCPPASITLTVPNQPGATSINVSLNNSQPLTAVVKDTQGVTLTGVALTFESTTPTTISAGAGSVNPIFPGSSTITAVCQPSTCNSAPFSQIGLFGNGEPITSNGIQVTSSGTNATVLFIASTQSQYLLPVDFSTGQPGALVKLPYTPNSMVISNDGSSIYLGSSSALMTVSAINNQVSAANQNITGKVLSVSPDGGTVVVTDPIRQTVSLVAGGNVVSTYGGVGTSAQWSPDSATVYITALNNQLLVHSTFTGWLATTTANQYVDVAVTVPSVGAFFATNTNITEGRSYCPQLVSTAPGTTPGAPPVTTNIFYPVANDTAVKTDKVAATNDGFHILGATVTPAATVNDIAVDLAHQPQALACPTTTGPLAFNSSVTPHPIPGVTATAITGIVPASNSALSFVTYIGTSGLLPEYIPSTGAISNVALSSGAVAPVAGIFSSDNLTFFAGTSGDNQVHLITINGTTATDTSVIAPKLPDANGNIVAPNLLVQRPKRSNS
jgi:hypothetical protein